MKRSRSGHFGSDGLWRKCRIHSAQAISAIPIGIPGWPEFAFWTASIARARMALHMSRSSAMVGTDAVIGVWEVLWEVKVGGNIHFIKRAMPDFDQRRFGRVCAAVWPSLS